jgi:hypothetical protein
MEKRNTFLIIWFLTTVLFVWFIFQGHHTFDAPTTKYVIVALFLCTLALLRWLPGPLNVLPTKPRKSRSSWLILICIVTIVVMFLTRTLIGPPLLFAFPILAVGILIYLRPKIDQQEVLYATVLALVAGLTGLAAGWVPFQPIVWAILQVCLIISGLIAGWSVLRHTGLWQIGIGRSQFLDQGEKSALRSFGAGIAISIPWAMGIVLIGASASQQWIQRWWHPFIAINPGISEEVWGRIFLIPLLFLILRTAFRSKRAYVLALIIGSYWFAYLHTSGGLDGIVSTVLIGTLFVLPLTYICLHRDLETAIGFHFFVDFSKFVAALLLNAGLWWR